MYQVAMKMFTAVFMLLIASCGGDGLTGPPATATTSGTTTPVDVSINSVTVLSSNAQLASGNGQGVTITAIVKDSKNNLLKDKTVSFSASSGAISVTQGTTDAAGAAVAVLTTGGDESNRAITVTAASGTVTSSISVDVAGTVVIIDGEGSLVVGTTTALTIAVKDSFGKGLATQTVAITSANSNALSAATLTTNSAGQATLTVTGTNSGADTIRATSLGASASFSLSISADSFRFTTPSANNAEVNLAVVQPVVVNWTSAGVLQTGRLINLAATRGALSAASATTDANGNATVSISSTNAGLSTITATVANGTGVGLSAQRTVEFTAVTPTQVEVQASLASVAPGGEKSSITAVVRDVNFNLVKSKRVSFNLNDVTGGTLSTPAATTDSSGQATTVYTSGNTTSAKDAVTITALVEGTAVTNTVTLTVGARALFIAMGTGNTILEPDETKYTHPYTVYVTDANGNGVAGTVVTLSILSRAYHKGVHQWADPPKQWGPVYTAAVNCLSEDLNRNGSLDVGEDTNVDGLLTPGSRVSVDALVTTDATGFAKFNISYAQQYAYWLSVTLEARARVGGTEALAVDRFILTGAATDYNAEGVSPPGRRSPFGVSALCTDVN